MTIIAFLGLWSVRRLDRAAGRHFPTHEGEKLSERLVIAIEKKFQDFDLKVNLTVCTRSSSCLAHPGQARLRRSMRSPAS
jgi:hypothetical protein